jgi:ATP-dependent DNA helicase RecQ
VAIVGMPPFDMQRVLRCAERSVMFVSRLPSLAHSRMPRGPEMVIVGPNQDLGQRSLDPEPSKARFFLVPEDQVSPDGRRLRDVFGGRILTLDEFNERVAL